MRFLPVWLRRARMENEMNEELRFHLESRVSDLLLQGVPQARAERQARLEFGAIEAHKETCREAAGLRWVDELSADVSYTLRTLRRSPGFALASILSLAIGIGVNISCFISVNSIVLHPFPFPRLDRVMTVWSAGDHDLSRRSLVAAGDFAELRRSATSFRHLAAYRGWNTAITTADGAQRVQAALVTDGFFEALGMPPAAGRTFSAAECQPGSDGVAMVSHAFWKNHLGARPLTTESTIALDGRSVNVIGVMPEDFDFPLSTELWMPLALSPAARDSRNAQDLLVVGRLKPGVSAAQAHAEAATIMAAFAARYPATNRGRTALIAPLREIANEITNRFLLILLGAAIFVLLLACANIANLQLARSGARQREMEIRAALGASRYRIARQLLTESVVTALLGGVVAVVLARWSMAWQMAAIPAQVYQWVAGMRDMRIDVNVAAFAVALSLFAGVICCLPSVWRLLRTPAASAVSGESSRTASGGPAASRSRAVLVVTEVALALVLLLAAGLMVSTLDRMLALDPGFDTKNLLTMDATLPAGRNEGAAMRNFTRRAVAGLEVLPGVQSAAAFRSAGTAGKFLVEGRSEPSPAEPRPYIRAVTSGYFDAMRLPVSEGRAIDLRDGPDQAGIVVISQTIARHYWPGSSSVGARIRFGTQGAWLTVAGVTGDTRDWFGGNAEPAAYIAWMQAPGPALHFLLRTSGDPAQSVAGARAAIRAADPNVPVYNVKSMEQSLTEQTSGVRSAAAMMATYATIALLLAVMGCYALGAFSAAQRTREIGVRMALGATRQAVVLMVFRETAKLTAAGLAVGLSLALPLTTLMSHALFNLVALRPLTFAGFTALLGGAALLAGYVPAHRAARLDPSVALRGE